MQQDAVRNAQFAARDIIRRDGGDVTTIPVDNIGLATKKNVVDRYLGYMSTDDAKFEMAVGFIAGAGQRMVQSYSEKMFDNAAYRKLTKQIETIKRDLPAGTDQEKAYKQQKEKIDRALRGYTKKVAELRPQPGAVKELPKGTEELIIETFLRTVSRYPRKRR